MTRRRALVGVTLVAVIVVAGCSSTPTATAPVASSVVGPASVLDYFPRSFGMARECGSRSESARILEVVAKHRHHGGDAKRHPDGSHAAGAA